MSGREQDIKMMMAIIRLDKLSDVRTALAKVGASSLIVANVSGRGSQPVKKEQWHGKERTVDLHQRVRVEYVVVDIFADDAVDVIADAAQTGEKGDGKISALPVGSVVQVCTSREGEAAV